MDTIEGKAVLAVNMPQLQHALPYSLKLVNNALKSLPNLGFPSSAGFIRKFQIIVGGEEVGRRLRVTCFHRSFLKNNFEIDFLNSEHLIVTCSI